jgi:hypothetical protein
MGCISRTRCISLVRYRADCQPGIKTMDAGMPFSRPISDRYFEDYIEGDVHCFGTIAVEADDILNGGWCLLWHLGLPGLSRDSLRRASCNACELVSSCCPVCASSG